MGARMRVPLLHQDAVAGNGRRPPFRRYGSALLAVITAAALLLVVAPAQPASAAGKATLSQCTNGQVTAI